MSEPLPSYFSEYLHLLLEMGYEKDESEDALRYLYNCEPQPSHGDIIYLAVGRISTESEERLRARNEATFDKAKIFTNNLKREREEKTLSNGTPEKEGRKKQKVDTDKSFPIVNNNEQFNWLLSKLKLHSHGYEDHCELQFYSGKMWDRKIDSKEENELQCDHFVDKILLKSCIPDDWKPRLISEHLRYFLMVWIKDFMTMYNSEENLCHVPKTVNANKNATKSGYTTETLNYINAFLHFDAGREKQIIVLFLQSLLLLGEKIGVCIDIQGKMDLVQFVTSKLMDRLGITRTCKSVEGQMLQLDLCSLSHILICSYKFSLNGMK